MGVQFPAPSLDQLTDMILSECLSFEAASVLAGDRGGLEERFNGDLVGVSDLLMQHRLAYVSSTIQKAKANPGVVN